MSTHVVRRLTRTRHRIMLDNHVPAKGMARSAPDDRSNQASIKTAAANSAGAGSGITEGKRPHACTSDWCVAHPAVHLTIFAFASVRTRNAARLSLPKASTASNWAATAAPSCAANRDRRSMRLAMTTWMRTPGCSSGHAPSNTSSVPRWNSSGKPCAQMDRQHHLQPRERLPRKEQPSMTCCCECACCSDTG